MQKKYLIAFPFVVICLFAHLSFALVAPLTQEEREEFATDIVSGYVVSIKKKEVPLSFGTQTHYTVKMIISDIARGNHVAGNETLTVHYWKNFFEPGWYGDAGQLNSMKHYQMVKTYLKFNLADRRFELLSPNGFDFVTN